MSNLLIEFIQQQILGGDTEIALSPEDDLLGSGLVDSMSMMKLITFIEDKFELLIPPQDMTIENFMTIGHIQEYLERRKLNA